MREPAKVLVVASRTAGSAALLDALRERAVRGPARFTLLVPASWEIQDPHGGQETARRSLHDALERLAAAGLDAEGVVGDADPVAAVVAVWDPARFDEVIVSTFPAHLSKWLGLDLPRRVQRHTGVAVTHVVALDDEQPEQSS